MEQLTGITELDEVLSRLTSIQSCDEHDAVMEELFDIAPNYVDPIHELYDSGTYQNMSLIWCLIGQTSKQAMALFSKAIKDKDQYTRWAAAKALSEFRIRDASRLLVAALKDRSHLVKLTAVDAMSKFRDPQAVPQLEKICLSEHLKKNAPGIVSSAKKALKVCRRAR